MGIFLDNYQLGGEDLPGAYARMVAAGHDFRHNGGLSTTLIMQVFRSKDSYQAGKPCIEEVQVPINNQEDLIACITGNLGDYKGGPEAGTGLKNLAEFCLRDMPEWAGERD